eukprot:s177_g16.t1
MDKMDGSRLPSRLQGVLSDMQAAIQSLPGRPANEAWTQAERQLQKSLRKLHRRCNKSVEHLGAVATDDDLADAEVEAELHEVVHAACETGKTAPAASICASARSDQHLTLFRKMNEWGFLSDAEKLERLKQAEQAARCPWWNLSQAELTEIVILAAACLAAPRRDAKPEGADAVPFSDVETATTAAESRDPNLDLQGRVWSLLLHALHVWRMSQFDCHAIEHVLDFVQQKSNKFEDKVGDIAGAAAGKAWLKIKQAVDQLMLPTEAPSVTLVQGSQLATEMPVEASHQLKPHRVRVRLERQSGIQNITWSVALEMRRLSRPRFKEAKAYREELVHQGKLKPPKPIAATPRSTVRGVFFDRSQQKWHVRLYHPVTRKQVYGGCFRAKEKAEAKARELAAQLGVQPDIEVLPVRKLSDLRCFEKLGPAKGVTWDVKAQCWHAQCYIKGKKLGVFIRPQDFSNQAVKQAWDEAVSWRRQQKTVLQWLKNARTIPESSHSVSCLGVVFMAYLGCLVPLSAGPRCSMGCGSAGVARGDVFMKSCARRIGSKPRCLSGKLYSIRRPRQLAPRPSGQRCLRWEDASPAIRPRAAPWAKEFRGNVGRHCLLRSR